MIIKNKVSDFYSVVELWIMLSLSIVFIPFAFMICMILWFPFSVFTLFSFISEKISKPPIQF